MTGGRPLHRGVVGKGQQALKKNNLTRVPIREKRMWNNRLLNAQEAAEKAIEAVEDTCLAAYEGGMPYSSIAGSLGIHPTSAKDMCQRALDRRSEGSGEGSQ